MRYAPAGRAVGVMVASKRPLAFGAGREKLLRAVEIEDELDEARDEAAAYDFDRVGLRVDVDVVAAVGFERGDLGRRRRTGHVEWRHIALDHGTVHLLLNADAILTRRASRDIEGG